MTISALESYLDLLIASAQYGKKLKAFAYCAFMDVSKINAIESDHLLPLAMRRHLIRQCEASLGALVRLAARHGLGQEAANPIIKKWPQQVNQVTVFTSYRTVLKREGRPPTVREWVEQDLTKYPPTFSRLIERDPKERAKRIRDYKRKRDHAIRELRTRFKLPVTYTRSA